MIRYKIHIPNYLIDVFMRYSMTASTVKFYIVKLIVFTFYCPDKGDKIAGFLFEPIQGEAGVRMSCSIFEMS